jgi:mannose-1-phosphate guanylyltransferase/mannose-6-phosphate isomerase
MFVLRAITWLKALQQIRPDIATATQTALQGKSIDTLFVRPNKEAFTQVPSESVDYAVMEKCPGSNFSIHMVPLDAGWNDLGAWDAVWQVNQDGHQDAQGNMVQGDALLTDITNTFIHASSRLVGAAGVNNLIVVETADALLVADRSQSQNVKKLV